MANFNERIYTALVSAGHTNAEHDSALCRMPTAPARPDYDDDRETWASWRQEMTNHNALIASVFLPAIAALSDRLNAACDANGTPRVFTGCRNATDLSDFANNLRAFCGCNA